MISLAYNVKDFQISSGPTLLESERYDIEATFGVNAPERPGRLTFTTIQSAPQVRLMLQGVLSRLLGLPVVDKTGLAEYYEVLLNWTPDEAAADATPGPSIFAAIQETLGLRLKSGKEPVDVLVIDHVERPTAN